MAKDAPNHVPMNMIGLAQTSHEITEDGDVPIFLVVLINQNALQYTTAPLWDHIIYPPRRGYYNIYTTVHSMPAFTIPYCHLHACFMVNEPVPEEFLVLSVPDRKKITWVHSKCDRSGKLHNFI